MDSIRRFLRYLLFIFFVLNASNICATHIVGGEMNYRYLGPNHYEVTLTVYRDCLNGQAPFDNPAVIGIYDDDENLVLRTDAYMTMQTQVPNAINSPCLPPPMDICYEVAQYVFTVNLPSNPSYYTVAYQRCCRNYSIANMANVQSTGATYMAVITNTSVAAINSNPVFNDLPPTFICQDAPFTFDHAATDHDGDSLVYELSYPYEGGSISNRAPDPPSPPPYTPIIFLNPYTVNDPLGGVAMQINSHTGLLKATPNSTGQYVYGVTVKEYRNGVLLGETRRDFQVNVIPCTQITVASIYSPLIACGSLDANFVNNSYNAAAYLWDFGDASNPADSSTIKNPVYTYPDTGDYVATLIAYSASNPACNDTATGIVHVYPVFMTGYYITNDHCSDVFNFFDESYGTGGIPNYWSWNFGDNTKGWDKDVSHQYVNPGEYDVTLISSTDSGCVDTVVKKVYVLQNPVSDFIFSLDTCKYTIETNNTSQYAVSYRWDYGDHAVEYKEDGEHHYWNPGIYDIQLIVVTDSSCVDTASFQVSIPPLSKSDFSYNVSMCDSNVQFTNLSMNAVSFEWDFGDNESSQLESPLHTYSISGHIPVELSTVSIYGCEDILTRDIFFISHKKANFEAVLDSCKGVYNFIDLSNKAAYYLWEFGDSTTSADANPFHWFNEDGEYLVTLVLNDETLCADSITKVVRYESPLGEKLFVPNTFTPNGDGLNDNFMLSLFRPCEMYEITIFNRWGQIVFESDDAANVNWDGRYMGEQMPQDIYVYLITMDGKTRNGYINLMR